MIKLEVKIREKTLPNAEHYDDTKYSDDGFYIVKDKEVAVNDILIYVGPQYVGGSRFVAYMGEWETLRSSFEKEVAKVTPEYEGPSDPIHHTPGQVSEDFVLNLASVLTNGKKL